MERGNKTIYIFFLFLKNEILVTRVVSFLFFSRNHNLEENTICFLIVTSRLNVLLYSRKRKIHLDQREDALTPGSKNYAQYFAFGYVILYLGNVCLRALSTSSCGQGQKHSQAQQVPFFPSLFLNARQQHFHITTATTTTTIPSPHAMHVRWNYAYFAKVERNWCWRRTLSVHQTLVMVQRTLTLSHSFPIALIDSTKLLNHHFNLIMSWAGVETILIPIYMSAIKPSQWDLFNGNNITVSTSKNYVRSKFRSQIEGYWPNRTFPRRWPYYICIQLFSSSFFMIYLIRIHWNCAFRKSNFFGGSNTSYVWWNHDETPIPGTKKVTV